MKIRVAIVDDEALARQRVRLLAAEEADLEVVAEYAHGLEAVEGLRRDRVELVFLDVQMPELDGFEVLRRLAGEAWWPVVIFTTAFDQHAVRAFEAQALDYLLKPFKPDRFRAAVARARECLADRAARQALQVAVSRMAGVPQPPCAPTDGGPGGEGEGGRLARLTVKTKDRWIVVPTGEVEWIESAGNYVAVHAGGEEHILRETLNALEGQLDPERFLRISRSAIVNLDRVRELQPMFKGEQVVVLQGGKVLAVTRGLREVERALRYSGGGGSGKS